MWDSTKQESPGEKDRSQEGNFPTVHILLCFAKPELKVHFDFHTFIAPEHIVNATPLNVSCTCYVLPWIQTAVMFPRCASFSNIFTKKNIGTCAKIFPFSCLDEVSGSRTHVLLGARDVRQQ